MERGHGAIAVVGAGPGLGLAVARRFGLEGYRVALVARNAERLETMRRELAADGIHAAAFAADCVDGDQIVRALSQAQRELGEIDVLVYNAARLGLRASPLELSPGSFNRSLQVDVVSALVAVQTVMPSMQERQRGTILLTGGSWAMRPSAEWCAPGAGKAALRNLGASLAEDFRPRNVHVAVVTIGGWIGKSEEYSLDRLSSIYWDLHVQEPSEWVHEVVV
jgi:NAD(P)-dependent dehydrogenase (short-subunit alcohol dehydrogenase family)